MELKTITKRRVNGQLDTDICLVDSWREDASFDDLDKLIYNFGSIHNGGLSKLVQFSNAVHQLILQPALRGTIDNVVNCRSFGSVYLIANLLERFGLASVWDGAGPDTESSQPIQFLPTLLVALLDDDTRPGHQSDALARRFYCPGRMTFGPQAVRRLLTTLAVHQHGVMNFSNSNSESDLAIAAKLTAWAGGEWGLPFNASLSHGRQTILYLAQALRGMTQRQTGSEWLSINEHLREVRVVQVSQHSRSVYLVTRLTAAQMSIFYRLEIPYPPLMLCEPAREWHPINAERGDEEVDELVHFDSIT